MTDEKTTDLAEATEEDAPEASAAAHDHDHEHGHDHDHDHDKEAFEFVKDPVFEVDYKGNCAYEVKVTVPGENGRKQSEELFSELIKGAQIPGFRKGKAPRGLVENKFGRAVHAESVDKLVRASVEKLIKDKEFLLVTTPKFDGLEAAKDIKPDQDIHFSMTFEVAPRCELGEYRGIEIEQPVLRVEDDEVEKALMGMRGRFTTYATVEGAEASDGDQVIIDFEGLVDGEPFTGSTAQGYPYILGSRRFFVEFESAIRGTKAGAEVACDVHFAADYSNKEVAGKTANFKIKINEIKRKTTPEFDDSFAQQVGFDSAEKMRERVMHDLRANASEEGRLIAERNILEKIVADSKFELPAAVIDVSAAEYYEQERRRLTSLRVPKAEIEAREDELRERAREYAIRNIKSFVVLNEVGRAEEIKVTEDDFLREAEALQKSTGADMDVVSRYMQQQDQREMYLGRIHRQKAMDIIWNSASITQKEVTREELKAAYDELEES